MDHEAADPGQAPRPKWDLIDAASLVCFDAGAVGLAAWVADLAGAAAGPYVNVVARPLVVIPVVILIARRWWGAGLADLGVVKPERRSWLWSVGFALAVAAAYVALGAALVLAIRYRLWTVNVAAFSDNTRRRLAEGGGIVPRALLALVAAPVVEELVFRGILYPALRERLGTRLAVPLSAAVFALMHLVWMGAIFWPVTQFLGGLIFAWSYERTRSLVFPMIFHAAGNAAILAWMLVLIHRPGWVGALLGYG